MQHIKLKSLAPARAVQQGAVLIVSLLLLLVMTVLALSVSQSTRMQERMAAGVRDSDLAFQSAEAGIRAAEDYLWSLTAVPSTCSTLSSTCYVYQVRNPATDTPLPFDMTTFTWSTTNSIEFGTANTQDILAGVVFADPRYTIEEYSRVADTPELGNNGQPITYKYFYRITSSGSGASNNGTTATVQALVQSTFTRPL